MKKLLIIALLGILSFTVAAVVLGGDNLHFERGIDALYHLDLPAAEAQFRRSISEGRRELEGYVYLALIHLANSKVFDDNVVKDRGAFEEAQRCLDIAIAQADIRLSRNRRDASALFYRTFARGLRLFGSNPAVIVVNVVPLFLDMRRVTQLDPNLADAHYMTGEGYRAIYYLTGLERYWEAAVEEFKRGVELGGDFNPFARYFLGRVYYLHKNYDEARDTFVALKEAYPGYDLIQHAANYHLALIAYQERHYEEARRYFVDVLNARYEGNYWAERYAHEFRLWSFYYLTRIAYGRGDYRGVLAYGEGFIRHAEEDGAEKHEAKIRRIQGLMGEAKARGGGETAAKKSVDSPFLK
ncbi:MAG: tetratricopeptide repeat protein [bacterium]